MVDAENRKISKLNIAVDTHKKNNDKNFMTILSAAKDRGLNSYLYLK